MGSRYVHIVVFLLFTNCGWTQSWVHKTRALLPKTDELSDVSSFKAAEKPFLFYDDSCELFENVISSYFSKLKTTSGAHVKRSSLLNALSNRAVAGLNVSRINKGTKHINYLRKLHRALIGIPRTYGYVEFTSFEIQVVNASGQFFYDEENGDSPYHLYKGKKPSSKEIESGEAKYEALKIFTEAELEAKILRKLKSSPIYAYCNKRQVTTFGISVVPKKRCFYRKGKPTIQVFVIIGFKRYDEKKLNSGKFRAAKRRQLRRIEGEIEHIDRLLKKGLIP